MRLTKSERESVRQKFGGLCSYCGSTLPERWHADHFDAVLRLAKYVSGKGFVPTGEAVRPENNRIENMMPACAQCNISKGSLDIEQWRKWLAGHVTSLNKHNTPYRLAKAFGLIAETGTPIVFHFEKGARRDE